MTQIAVSTMLNASPRRVWELVEDIESHKHWMDDATDIIITSPQRSGIGTTFTVPTAIGPFRLTDQMTITEWEPGVAMGVDHTGLVTGSGRFTLTPAGEQRTQFRWAEELKFPWWMGAAIGGVIGKRILEAVWRKNLRSLTRLVDEDH